MQTISFKEFLNATGGLPSMGGNVEASWESHGKHGKPWKAKRADVVQFWSRLKPNLPLQVEPIDPRHRGTRFQQDGLRITGLLTVF